MEPWMRAAVNIAYYYGLTEPDPDIVEAHILTRVPGISQEQAQEAIRLAAVGAANVGALRELEQQAQQAAVIGRRQSPLQRAIGTGDAPLSAFATEGTDTEGTVDVRVLVQYGTPTGGIGEYLEIIRASWSDTVNDIIDLARQNAAPAMSLYGNSLQAANIIGPLL